MHPTGSPSWNLSKNIGRYVENTNKKVVFFHSSSKINNYYFIIFPRRPILDLKFPLMCECLVCLSDDSRSDVSAGRAILTYGQI